MWIGLLTGGAHPERPAASAPVATLFVWDDRRRARVDGPDRGVADGIRMLRGSGRRGLGPPADPRCFVCREPYLIPDPAAIRAQEDIPVLDAHATAREAAGGGTRAGLGGETDAGDALVGDADADGPVPGGPPTPERSAVFALVHVEDHRPIGCEGEALVHVPGTQVVSLVPFAALDVFLSILGDVGYELPRCDRCGTLAPGGSLADLGMPGLPAPGRAGRRQGRRRAA